MAEPCIDSIEAWEVVVPSKISAFQREGLGHGQSSWDRKPIVLIESCSSDGLTACAELPRGHTLHTLLPDFERLLSQPAAICSTFELPAFLQPSSFYGLKTLFAPARWENPHALSSSYEQLQISFSAQRAGLRIADFLGGAVRENIPVDFWAGHQTPQTIERTVTSALNSGFGGIKIKASLDDDLISIIDLIRQIAGAEFSVTMDAVFQLLDPFHAYRKMIRLSETDAAIRLEDPFPQTRKDFWHELKRICRIPLIWHARDSDSLREALIPKVTGDAFNLSGRSITEFLSMAKTLEILGFSCWHGSGNELGVTQLYHLHAAAAARSCVLASDLSSALVREEALVTWHWPYSKGTLPLPSGVGLGAGLDKELLPRYTQEHIKLRNG